MTRRVRSATLRGTAAYMSVGLGQRAIGFLLLPLYARALRPSEYGVIALLMTVFGGAQYLFSFGLEIAVFRGYFQYADDSACRQRFINTLGLFLMGAPLLLASTAAITMTAFLGGRGYPTGLISAELFTATAYVAATVMPLAIIRAEERLGAYIKINVAYALTQILTKAFLVIALDMGVRGWIASDLSASLVMLLFSLLSVQHRWSKEFDTAYLVGALTLGLPMVPHLLSHWALALADRLLLATALDAQQVGVYSMGYQFGILLGMALTEINRALMPTYGRAVRSESARRALTSTATTQILAAAILGALTAAVAPPAIRILLPDSYWGAASVIPLIALGYIFYGWYYVPMNAVSLVAGDTALVWIPTVAAAAINVGLNLWLIPIWGIKAAAFNTASCYGALFAMLGLYKRFRVGWKIPLRLRALSGSLLLIGVTYAAAITFLPSQGLTAVILRFAALAIASAVVFHRHSSEVESLVGIGVPSVTSVGAA